MAKLSLVQKPAPDWELKCLCASGQVRIVTKNYLIFIGGQGKAMYFEHRVHGREIYGKATFWHDVAEMKSYFSPTGHDLPAEVIKELIDMGVKVKGFHYYLGD